jgi:hypothetical protein
VIRFKLDLDENEVGYIVNVALAAQPIRDALPLMQKIIAQTQEQAQRQQQEQTLGQLGIEQATQ